MTYNGTGNWVTDSMALRNSSYVVENYTEQVKRACILCSVQIFDMCTYKQNVWKLTEKGTDAARAKTPCVGCVELESHCVVPCNYRIFLDVLLEL